MKHFEIPKEEDAVKADNQARVVEPYDSSAERDESIKLEAGQCETVKQDGQRCRAHALGGKSACFFHDSGSAEERTVASSRGGSGKHSATLPAGTPDFPLRNSTDAAALLARTVNQLLRGEIDPKIANGAGFLIGILMKAQDASRLEERLSALEAAIGKQVASKIL